MMEPTDQTGSLLNSGFSIASMVFFAPTCHLANLLLKKSRALQLFATSYIKRKAQGPQVEHVSSEVVALCRVPPD